MAVTAPSWAPIVSFSLLIVVLAAAARAGGMSAHAASWRRSLAIAGAGVAARAVPAALGLPAFYDSLLYLMLLWVVLATSWNILSGYSGYFSFGHGAFFGAGMYTTARCCAALDVPFLWTLPVAAAVAALLGVGARRGRLSRRGVRGELFALLTLAVTFVIGTIVLNTPIDGGPGVSLSAVPVPHDRADAVVDLLPAGARRGARDAADRLGASASRASAPGLFAIHDDEDVAEVMGVPTYRYKLVAFAISCALAGVAGGIHALFCRTSRSARPSRSPCRSRSC